MDTIFKLACTLLVLTSVDADLQENITLECQAQYKHYTDSLQTREEWAVRMLDSMGRQESGVLDGNYIFEGNFDECNAVAENKSSTNSVKGLFCIAYWQHNNTDRKDTMGLGYCIPNVCNDRDAFLLLKDMNPFSVQPRVDITVLNCVRQKDLSSDVGAIVSIIILALFGVISLTATGLEIIKQKKEKQHKKMITNLKHSSNDEIKTSENIGKYNTAFEEDIKTSTFQNKEEDLKSADPDEQTYFEKSQDASTDAFKSINGNIHHDKAEQDINEVDNEPHISKFVQPSTNQSDTSLQIVDNNNKYTFHCESETTDEHVHKCSGKLSQVFLTFSLLTNVPAIISINHSFGPYRCLHPLRFLAMVWILLGHTYDYGNFTTAAPVVANRWTMFSSLEKFTFFPIINWSLSVETFFILGAVDVTALIMKEMEDDGGRLTSRHAIMYFISKYCRRTPVYMVVFMFYTNLFEYLADGPFLLPHIPDIETCHSIWWRHVLYIQNLFTPFTECMAWSSYMPLDFQFHVMAFPFVLITCWKPRYGTVLTILGMVGSFTANVYLNYDLEYNRPDGSFFDEIYLKPWTRSQTYFMGMLLGYFLYHNTSKRIKMKKIIVLSCWALAICLCMASVHVEYTELCKDTEVECTEWDKTAQIFFYSLQRPMFACCVIWIIFACETGNGGIFNTIFCWKIWIPLSRLSYVGYLIHPLFVFYFSYSRPVQLYYYHWMLIYMFLGHVCLTMSTAILVSAVFELPMARIEEIFIPKDS